MSGRGATEHVATAVTNQRLLFRFAGIPAVYTAKSLLPAQ
jgi:hypothetical protein